MSNRVVNLTDVDFASQIAAGVTLVDFFATWCGPCKMQGPIVEKVAECMGGNVKVAKVNIDDAMQTAVQYSVRSVPTLMIFKDGKPVQQWVGVQSETDLVAALEQTLDEG